LPVTRRIAFLLFPDFQLLDAAGRSRRLKSPSVIGPAAISCG
jgi:hypothetical protein